jgi:hypothetical protein
LRPSYEKRVLSEIHSSLISSFRRGMTRITFEGGHSNGLRSQTYLATTRVHIDVGANGIHHVNGLSAAQLPGAGLVCVRLGGEGSDRAHVYQISRNIRRAEVKVPMTLPESSEANIFSM